MSPQGHSLALREAVCVGSAVCLCFLKQRSGVGEEVDAGYLETNANLVSAVSTLSSFSFSYHHSRYTGLICPTVLYIVDCRLDESSFYVLTLFAWEAQLSKVGLEWLNCFGSLFENTAWWGERFLGKADGKMCEQSCLSIVSLIWFIHNLLTQWWRLVVFPLFVLEWHLVCLVQAMTSSGTTESPRQLKPTTTSHNRRKTTLSSPALVSFCVSHLVH